MFIHVPAKFPKKLYLKSRTASPLDIVAIQFVCPNCPKLFCSVNLLNRITFSKIFNLKFRPVCQNLRFSFEFMGQNRPLFLNSAELHANVFFPQFFFLTKMLSITTKTAVFFILSISISDGKGTLVAPKSQIQKYYLSLWKGTVVGAES